MRWPGEGKKLRKVSLVCSGDADICNMGLGLNLFGIHAVWLGCGHSPAGGCGQTLGLVLAEPILSEPKVLGLFIAVLLFFVLWVTAWSRNQRHLDERQTLHFELLSRDEELKRERSDLAA